MEEKIVLNILVELAGLEEEMIAARALQARNRDREQSLGELQEEYRQDEDEAARSGVDCEIRFRNREGEILQVETLLKDRRVRLGALTETRQVEAMQHEIAQLEQRLDALETRALELLDEAGETNREVEEARRQTLRLEGQRQAQRETMRSDSTRAAAAEQELQQEIERLVGLLPAPVSRHVQRLRQGLEQSVVYLAGGACGGCFGQLPAQQGIAAEKGSGLVRCASCSRYVVHRPWR